MRETNTMPQWAGSCWYYLRYLDPKNDGAFCAREAERYWMGAPPGRESKVERREPGAEPPSTLDAANANFKLQTSNLKPRATSGVDLYVGGTEHAVLHLLY